MGGAALTNETEKTSIKQLFQQMSSGNTVEVLQGMVISENPIKIQMINDEKLIIGANITYIPRHLTDYKTQIDIVQKGGTIDSKTKTDGSHSHSGVHGQTSATTHSHALDTFHIYDMEITVYNALKTGEKVHILSFHQGKQYYVLDRVAL